MNKRLKSIIAAVASVIVLIAMLVILVNLPSNHISEQYALNAELTINNNSSLDIKSINIKNSNDTYTVNVDNDICSIDDLKNLPTSTEYFSALLSDCSNIIASQVIDEDCSDISIFGLTNPRATVNINYNDESSIKLNVGADAPQSAGVYVNVDDSSKIYLFSSDSVDTFLYSKNDFIDKTITSQPKTEILQKATLEGSSRPEPIVFELENNDSSYNTYKLISPALKATDANQVSAIIEQTQYLIAEDVIAINPTNEQLDEYGLLQPYSKITTQYSNNSITLITSAPQNDKVYIMNTNVPIIYKISSKDKTFITAQYYDLVSKTILSPTLSTVKNLTVTFDNSYYNFDIALDNSQNLTVKCNDNNIDADIFKVYYQNIIGMKNQGFTTEPLVDTNHILTCTFKYVDNNKADDIISFYKSEDENISLISLNGICDSFEYKTYTDKIMIDSYNVSISQKIEPINN